MMKANSERRHQPRDQLLLFIEQTDFAQIEFVLELPKHGIADAAHYYARRSGSCSTPSWVLEKNQEFELQQEQVTRAAT